MSYQSPKGYEDVVVPAEPCPNRPDGTTLGPLVCVTKDGNECRGCLRDGRRALLDQAVPVGAHDHLGIGVICWQRTGVES